MHTQWQRRDLTLDELERGRALAEVMVAAGDEPEQVERQLLAVGLTPAAAIQAVSLTISRGRAGS